VQLRLGSQPLGADGFPRVLVELGEANPAVSFHAQVVELGATLGVETAGSCPTVGADQSIRHARHRLLILADEFEHDPNRRPNTFGVWLKLLQRDGRARRSQGRRPELAGDGLEVAAL